MNDDASKPYQNAGEDVEDDDENYGTVDSSKQGHARAPLADQRVHTNDDDNDGDDGGDDDDTDDNYGPMRVEGAAVPGNVDVAAAVIDDDTDENYGPMRVEGAAVPGNVNVAAAVDDDADDDDNYGPMNAGKIDANDSSAGTYDNDFGGGNQPGAWSAAGAEGGTSYDHPDVGEHDGAYVNVGEAAVGTTPAPARDDLSDSDVDV